jgi:hypothetical protein
VYLERLTSGELEALLDALECEVDDASLAGDVARIGRLLEQYQEISARFSRLGWRRLYRRHLRASTRDQALDRPPALCAACL